MCACVSKMGWSSNPSHGNKGGRGAETQCTVASETLLTIRKTFAKDDIVEP